MKKILKSFNFFYVSKLYYWTKKKDFIIASNFINFSTFRTCIIRGKPWNLTLLRLFVQLKIFSTCLVSSHPRS